MGWETGEYVVMFVLGDSEFIQVIVWKKPGMGNRNQNRKWEPDYERSFSIYICPF